MLQKQTISFEPAYRQLRQSERVFVDGIIAFIEREAIRTREPMLTVLRTLKVENYEPYEQDMLVRMHVRTAIFDRIRELSEQSELNIYRTLKEMRAIAYSNMGDYLKTNDGGFPELSLEKCTPEQLSAVKTIKHKISPMGKVEIEVVLHDKLTALIQIMKYQGLLGDENEHWKSTNRKLQDTDTLDVNLNDEQVAENYARYLSNG